MNSPGAFPSGFTTTDGRVDTTGTVMPPMATASSGPFAAPAASLGALALVAGHAFEVAPRTPLREVVDRLEAETDLPGAMVVANGRLVAVLSRAAIAGHVTRTLGRELSDTPPLDHLLATRSSPIFTLPAQMGLADAVGLALARDRHHAYAPVVVAYPDGSRRLIDLRPLLIEQCALLTRTMGELDVQRRAAEAATQAKSEFLANMSHEIRTPMTAILGYAVLLGEPGQTPDERRGSLETIRRNGEHLLTIINDILDLSKSDAGMMSVERIPCDPALVVDEVVALMRVRAVSKGLELSAAHPRRGPAGGPPPRIMSDPARLRQIVINLVGNAIKFTDAGSVEVRTAIEPAPHAAPTGSAVLRVEVIDTGVGITPGEASRLFRPFTQADSSITRRYGGTGLGLSISKRLAVMLGGDLSVVSVPGVRTIFTLTCAAEPAPAAPPVATPDAPSAARAGRLAILLAEDGLDNQRLLRHHLTRAGFEVEVAADGAEALRVAASRSATGRGFDAVLMDMQMPVMGGEEATRELRRRGYDGPILALTAHADADARDACLRAGCDAHLVKPIDAAALVAAVCLHAARRERPPLAA